MTNNKIIAHNKITKMLNKMKTNHLNFKSVSKCQNINNIRIKYTIIINKTLESVLFLQAYN